jgi:hypothetical protein
MIATPNVQTLIFLQIELKAIGIGPLTNGVEVSLQTQAVML